MEEAEMVHREAETTFMVRARQYQLEILERAKKENTIAYLETGCGKTLISVLLIKSKANELRKDADNRKTSMFLVPNVHLVYQQSDILRIHTDLDVGSYCGDMGVDYWDDEKWKVELEKNQVLVMTPQIFLDCLRHCFMQIPRVNLIVFDECHHARGRHPYSLIMDGFYYTASPEDRPSIFGMTASPLNKSGVQSRTSCAEQMRKLEKKLDATICTVKDRTELEKFVPTPVETFLKYVQGTVKGLTMDAEEKLNALLKELSLTHEHNKDLAERLSNVPMSEEEVRIKDSQPKDPNDANNFMLAIDARKKASAAKKASWTIRSLGYILKELGRWCGAQAAERALEHCKDSRIGQGDSGSESDSDDDAFDAQVRNIFIRKAWEILHLDGQAPPVDAESDVVLERMVNEGWITPKVQVLVRQLLKYRDQASAGNFRCIVFVDRIIAADVIAQLLQALPFMNFLPCASVTGHKGAVQYLTSKKQDAIIKKFRNGTLSLLVATDVVEEGLDVQSCSSVIRFDLSKSVRSHVQSRGRARRPGSDYILMMESGNEDHLKQLECFRRSESLMKMEAIEQTPLEMEVELDDEPVETYHVESTGAVVDDHHAVQLLFFYCNKLPNDRYSITAPRFDFKEDEHGVFCRIRLPSNAPESVRFIKGPTCVHKKKARQRAALEACRLLHKCKALDDQLVPEGADKSLAEIKEKQRNPLPKSGQWFEETVPAALQGEWIVKDFDEESNGEGGVWLFACGIRFEDKGLIGLASKDREVTRDYSEASDYVLITEKELDEDTSRMRVPLYFANGVCSAAVLSPLEKVFLSSSKLRKAKLFHSWVFTRALMREWMEGSGNLWSSSRAYLLLPMVNGVGREETGSIAEKSEKDHASIINWKVIESISDTIFCLSLSADGQSTSPIRRRKRDQGDEALLHLEEGKLMTRGGPYSAACLPGKIVTYNGKEFYILSVLEDRNAESPFPDSDVTKKRRFKAATYLEYYAKKRGIELRYPKQSLLEARPFRRASNLLHPRNNELGVNEPKSKQVEAEEDPEEKHTRFHEILPPELCQLHVELAPPIFRGALRLPSILRRIECMLRAAELKAKIGVPIRTEKVLEAITSPKGQEGYSYEQYEFLGDAFLKYVVSVFLYITQPTKHEGILSSIRKANVSNAHLCKRALEQGMMNIIVAHQFEPSTWSASGVKHAPTDFSQENGNGSKKGKEKEKEKPEETTKKSRGDQSDESSDDELESQNDALPYVDSNGILSRKLHSKTLADVVESLIGVYYSEGGPANAMKVLAWFGMDFDITNMVRPEAIIQAPGKEMHSDDAVHGTAECSQEVVCELGEEKIPPSSSAEALSVHAEEAVKGRAKCMRPNSDGFLGPVNVRKVESILDYHFHNPELLVQALMHSSYADNVGVPCYQRLEFLGDAVIDCITTVNLISKHSSQPPGKLSVMRAMSVCNETLARVAVRNSLQQHLCHASSELMSHITKFVHAVNDEEERRPTVNASGQNNLGAYGLISDFAPKVLGDLVESIVGAVFVDNKLDMKAAEKVCDKLLPKVTPETVALHPVTQFHHLCQQTGKDGKLVPSTVATEEGLFTVEVIVDGKKIGEVTNSQTKLAKKLAAALGYQKLMSLNEDCQSVNGDTEIPLLEDGSSKEGNSTNTKKRSPNTDLQEGIPRKIFKRKQKKKDKAVSFEEGSAATASVPNTDGPTVIASVPNEEAIVPVKEAPAAIASVPNMDGPKASVPNKDAAAAMASLPNKEDAAATVSLPNKEAPAGIASLPNKEGPGAIASVANKEDVDKRKTKEESLAAGSGDDHPGACLRDSRPIQLSNEPTPPQTTAMEPSCHMVSVDMAAVDIDRPVQRSAMEVEAPARSTATSLSASSILSTCGVNGSSAIDSRIYVDPLSRNLSDLGPSMPRGSMSMSATLVSERGRSRAMLNELCSRQGWLLDYILVNEEGPRHMRRFIMKAVLDMKDGTEKEECEGEAALNYKLARESAAVLLLAELQRKGYFP